MKRIIIPLALATTLACGFAQAQERDRGDQGERAARSGDVRERSADTRVQRADALPRVERDRPATSGDGIDARQARQRARIHDGVESGQLTRREATRLRGEQRTIQRQERRARADGVVTPRERAQLNRHQTRASRHINQQRHDRQQRAGAGRGHDRGRHLAYGRGNDRGRHLANGRGQDRGRHLANGRGQNRGNHYAYGHRNQRSGAQSRTHSRLRHGVASGRITPRQAHRIQTRSHIASSAGRGRR